MYRRFVVTYKEVCCEDAGYTPTQFPYAQQIALCECTKIQAAYHNNIKAHFGNRLRAYLNKLFKTKEKAKTLRKEMHEKGSSKKEIKEAIRSQVYAPCNQIKLVISKKRCPRLVL